MRMLIGEWIDAADGRVDGIRNDAGGELIETAPYGGMSDVTRAIEKAQRARRAMAAMPPKVLTGLPADSPALQDEVFGPVLPQIPSERYEDAVTAANLGPYGSQGALFTRDLKRAMQADFQKFDVAAVVTNHSTAIGLENPPFGDTKMSGNARMTGNAREDLHETFRDMTEQKTC
jgi:acyl-CoA reductase-like NAD-dependent aldehyde dehydrogenase